MTSRRVGPLLVAVILLVCASTSAAAYRQDDDNGNGNDSGLRTVYGEVVDKADKPVKDAVVYLKNVHTLSVRTYISSADGAYRFAGLDPNADYEIHAEYNDFISNNRTISSFNTRKEIHVPLKVDKQKKHGQ